MLLKEFIKQALEREYLGERIPNWDKSKIFLVHEITVDDGGVDPQWEIAFRSKLCCEMLEEMGKWQQQNNPKGGNLASKELEDRWRNGYSESVSLHYADDTMPKVIEDPKPEDDDPTCGGDLSVCEQCDEIAWDGRICHACGLKII